MRKLLFAVFIAITAMSYSVTVQHPSMLLTKEKIATIRKEYKKYPLFKKAVDMQISIADNAVKNAVEVPKPAGKGGSYSHTVHSNNAINFYACGAAYQITGNKAYAAYIRDGLIAYSKKYSTFGKHPDCTPHFPGVLFFQELNESVWMVRVAQAYDCIYDFLTLDERKTIENDLFRSMVEWETVENGKAFNYMHNHATWGTSAVGMLGYATGNMEWVKMALYGTKSDGSGGFLRQMEVLFSPDGYYEEGPYYHRYALMPFVIFSTVINHYQPDMRIFERRNGILRKAVDAIIQLSSTNGLFFPFNDADKAMGIRDEAIINAVDIAYAEMMGSTSLLDVVLKQNAVSCTDAGFEAAKAIAAGKTKPFGYKNIWFNDGQNGDEGGIGVLRDGQNDNQQIAILKAAKQGQGHGHYDRLNLMYYDRGEEIFGDYGFARYVDIESKRGGEYLPENKTFAKQTVIHNAPTVDQRTNFLANYNESMKTTPEKLFFVDTENISAAAAIEKMAYKGVKMTRTVAFVKIAECEKALLLDVCKMESAEPHLYELPYWYNGQLINIPFAVKNNTDTLVKAGTMDGYEHLWMNAESTKINTGSTFLTFMKFGKYYTTTFTAGNDMSVKFVTIGATDPEFSLRNEKGFILSAQSKGNQTFCSVTEAQEGETSKANKVIAIQLIENTADKDIVVLKTSGKEYKIKIDYMGKTIGDVN
jgi:oligo-alginate lyase